MSDTAVSESPQTTHVLPELPTLPSPSATPTPALPPEQRGAAPPMLPDSTPSLPAATELSSAVAVDGAPSLPLVSPVLSAPGQQMQPAGGVAVAPVEPANPVDPVAAAVAQVGAMPVLPDAPAAKPTTIEDPTAPEDDESDHPMGHLMPSKSKPSEASKWAAELRAAQKAKAKKIKIGITVGAIAFAALVGPPAVSWLTNAINETGTTTEEPAE